MSAMKKLSPATYEAILAELCPCCAIKLPLQPIYVSTTPFIHYIPGWHEKHPQGGSGFVCDASELRKLREEKK